MTSAGKAVRFGPKASDAERLRPGLEGLEGVVGVTGARAGWLGVATAKDGAPWGDVTELSEPWEKDT